MNDDKLNELSEEIDLLFQEHISYWDYSNNYRLSVFVFLQCFVENYFFDITFENNIKYIKNSLKKAKKILIEKKNLYKRYNDWDYFLDANQEDESFLYALKLSFGDRTTNISNWDDLSNQTFIEYINDSIQELKEVESACLDFLSSGKHETIEKVFNK